MNILELKHFDDEGQRLCYEVVLEQEGDAMMAKMRDIVLLLGPERGIGAVIDAGFTRDIDLTEAPRVVEVLFNAMLWIQKQGNALN